MTIKKWNEIEHAFTTKFGWYDGLRHMMDIGKPIYKERSIYELNEREDYLLIKKLRNKYDKEPTWHEKENHK
tara:strand:+ start:222 stop:437 length:216 start_codon:yes stop_codon:yes gene_type:complete